MTLQQRNDLDAYVDEVEQHLAIILPDTCDVTHLLLPIFSSAKLLHISNDISFPYFQFLDWNKHRKDNERYNSMKEYQWENKTNKLYWRGSTTGGRNTINNYEKNHRVRFIKKVNSNPFLAENSNALLHAVIQCDQDACAKMRSEFRISSREAFDENWKYKYLIDIEGNSFSLRLKSFLHSNSLVFRHQAFFPEFFMQWIEPGKHYIQIKFDFSDLEEKLKWAMNNESETEIKEIVNESTNFIQNHLRMEDVHCYIYRLLLDYSKLLDYVPHK